MNERHADAADLEEEIVDEMEDADEMGRNEELRTNASASATDYSS